MKIKCPICPNSCMLSEGQVGLCRARINKDGKIICENYGKLTAIALDPIEKKPLYRFFPGKMILSVGSYGCNLRCPFCQNYDISMADDSKVGTYQTQPDYLVDVALSMKDRNNIGIAYTYNEPLISYEYVKDCSVLAREKGLKNVLVTNGYVCREPLDNLLLYIDAMNIDLKAFNEDFYRKIGGDLETVKDTIVTASKSCHVEVTTLVIPGENDSVEEITSASRWIASIDENIPYHISAFYPRYKYSDKRPTSRKSVYDLVEEAKKYLKYVYPGNC
ncbi:MAG TPA: AmmeMemoRadiSam system radical SAM enzyme [Clostridia bacterium]|jgi:pyruvate formate lyase activating enzyme|nr:AmmeMemoRadiSam system radical SAM enzyme [Clostridiaceae bacterium]HOF27678.1 AmmeMemoRadiSam system radical SAM enzyme [Clostridia bacterium]HOM34013.1 AmmeMemoRadiSam system radical SAM enzyme [Clostridia bacterium]HOT69719.1 AmmeMemoRadiSam system radical SAM enzyme [Clostridia bacterium]HQF99968.1 AmmeMemoRadiSam system radical SAM enzyme [Clostridia bacterium]